MVYPLVMSIAKSIMTLDAMRHSCLNIFRSIHNSRPPSRSYIVSISALTFNINIRCSSVRHSGSGPSLANTGLLRSMATIFLRSLGVKARRASLPEMPELMIASDIFSPSHSRPGTLSRVFSCCWASDPYLYVDMIEIPWGSPSTRA